VETCSDEENSTGEAQLKRRGVGRIERGIGGWVSGDDDDGPRVPFRQSIIFFQSQDPLHGRWIEGRERVAFC